MQFNTKKIAQLALSVAGISFLSLPFMQTVQAQGLPNLCNDNESTFVQAETRNFFVNICGSELPLTYVGRDKKTGRSIRLPLTVDGTRNRGTYFEAVNGDVKYAVTITSRKKNLIVTQNKRVLQREVITRSSY